MNPTVFLSDDELNHATRLGATREALWNYSQMRMIDPFALSRAECAIAKHFNWPKPTSLRSPHMWDSASGTTQVRYTNRNGSLSFTPYDGDADAYLCVREHQLIGPYEFCGWVPGENVRPPAFMGLNRPRTTVESNRPERKKEVRTELRRMMKKWPGRLKDIVDRETARSLVASFVDVEYHRDLDLAPEEDLIAWGSVRLHAVVVRPNVDRLQYVPPTVTGDAVVFVAFPGVCLAKEVAGWLTRSELAKLKEMTFRDARTLHSLPTEAA